MERHEGVVRQDAAMWAMVAELFSHVAMIAGMTAENQQRSQLGKAMAYSDSGFIYHAEGLTEIAEKLRKEI